MYYYYYYLLFRAAPASYESSQARGQFGPTAAGACHSNTGFRPRLWRILQLTAILDPWPGVRARLGIKSAFSWILIGFFSAAPERECLKVIFLKSQHVETLLYKRNNKRAFFWPTGQIHYLLLLSSLIYFTY